MNKTYLPVVWKIKTGRTLRVGEVRKRNDICDFGDGWAPLPEPFVGHAVQNGERGVFIRRTRNGKDL